MSWRRACAKHISRSFSPLLLQREHCVFPRVTKRAVGYQVLFPVSRKMSSTAAEDMENLSLGQKPTDAEETKSSQREKSRLNKESGARIEEDQGKKIGGPFTLQENPLFLDERLQIFNELYEKQQQLLESTTTLWPFFLFFFPFEFISRWFIYIHSFIMNTEKPRETVTVSLPDGNTQEATAWETTPLDVANNISKSLAKKAVVAKVSTSRIITLFLSCDESIGCFASSLDRYGIRDSLDQRERINLWTRKSQTTTKMLATKLSWEREPK